MKITVNDIVENIADNTTVAQLIEARGIAGQGGVAVAVNGKVVKKVDWDTHTLHELDSVLIINAAYGG